LAELEEALLEDLPACPLEGTNSFAISSWFFGFDFAGLEEALLVDLFTCPFVGNSFAISSWFFGLDVTGLEEALLEDLLACPLEGTNSFAISSTTFLGKTSFASCSRLLGIAFADDFPAVVLEELFD